MSNRRSQSGPSNNLHVIDSGILSEWLRLSRTSVSTVYQTHVQCYSLRDLILWPLRLSGNYPDTDSEREQSKVSTGLWLILPGFRTLTVTEVLRFHDDEVVLFKVDSVSGLISQVVLIVEEKITPVDRPFGLMFVFFKSSGRGFSNHSYRSPCNEYIGDLPLLGNRFWEETSGI